MQQGKAWRDTFYLEKDADLEHLKGKLIASLGYGSQGHAQAQNLRDSGLDVIVGNVEDRYAETARKDGFEVVSIADAVRRADVLLVLLPDEHQRQIYLDEIEPHLREGQVLDFASGYAVHFGLIEPPPFVDVVLCVPACLGEIARRRYVEGKGDLRLLRRAPGRVRQRAQHRHGARAGDGLAALRLRRVQLRR